MGTRDLPDTYTLSPRACGPWASGVYIRQTTRAHGITIKYTNNKVTGIVYSDKYNRRE